MPPMNRDHLGRCLKKGTNDVAGQSENAKFPPHDTAVSVRTTRERAAQYREMLLAAQYRYRPEAVTDGTQLLGALLGMVALPTWLDIADVKTD